jgi:hypothetical protein
MEPLPLEWTIDGQRFTAPAAAGQIEGAVGTPGAKSEAWHLQQAARCEQEASQACSAHLAAKDDPDRAQEVLAAAHKATCMQYRHLLEASFAACAATGLAAAVPAPAAAAAPTSASAAAPQQQLK